MSQRLIRISAKARKEQRWEIHKDTIRSLYLDMDHTLKETMQNIGKTYNLKACERKWKEKLKDWKFEKNVSAAAMSIIVAKSEKRKREHGKETQYFHGSAEVKREKLKTFKKRKFSEVIVVVSPRADTPEGITYCAPGPETPHFPYYSFFAVYDEQEPQEKLHPSPRTGFSKEISAGPGDTASDEDDEALPSLSHNYKDRNMLIQSIARKSMLWHCPGRGLHTMDEEDVLGDEGEDLLPHVVSNLIAIHMAEARINRDNQLSKSVAIKYLGSTILAFERKCLLGDILQNYVSEFLDFLEAGPGACVIALQESSQQPSFQCSQYSDVCRLYHEVLMLLQRECQLTSKFVARACVLLANLETLYPEMIHHAETLYSVAIEGYEKMEKFDDLFQWNLSLAGVLCNLNRPFDAYELLSRECGRYLRDHLDSWVAHLPIGALYNLTSLFSTGSGVRPSIFRIKRLLSRKAKIPKGSRENDYLYLMMLAS